MPRAFHPSPQLFRIPEDADADEDQIVIPEPLLLFSPVVWVAIQRDDCILVDIGEEDVPDVVIETAQCLLWENSGDQWTEYDTNDRIWKGLRYNEPPCWSFACVYNSQQLSLLECRRWILEQVRWTATVRKVEPAWLHGDYHACQMLFAPLLQERLQTALGVSGATNENYDSFEADIENGDDSDLPANNLFGIEGDTEGDGEEPLNQSDDEGCWETLPVVPTDVNRAINVSMAELFSEEESMNRKKEVKSVAFQGETKSTLPTTPPRQPYGSPSKGTSPVDKTNGAPPRQPYGSPSKSSPVDKATGTPRPQPYGSPSKGSPARKNGSSPQSTEELVKRLAVKQAELDRRRQEEREKRISPRKETEQASPMVKVVSQDADSGSLTSATADDEEELCSLMDDRGDPKTWKCWFLPSLPHAKAGALAP